MGKQLGEEEFIWAHSSVTANGHQEDKQAAGTRRQDTDMHVSPGTTNY